MVTKHRKNRIHQTLINRQRDLVVVLDEVHDAHNVNAILRSAEAIGISNIYLKYKDELVKIYDANLIGYACIIDRTDNKTLLKNKIISQIKFRIDTFKQSELPDYLKKIPSTEPGSRNINK